MSCVGLYTGLQWITRDYDPLTTDVYYPFLPDHDSIEWVESNADISFPSSAREIYIYNLGWNENLIMVNFIMDAEDLGIFMSTTLCQGGLESIEVDNHPISTPEWWQQNEKGDWLGCFEYIDPARQTIEIDISNPAEYHVFVTNSIY